VEERLEQVKAQYQSVRQDTITSELMDVVSGAEALASEHGTA
jgi:F0F1-type ATP synthase gamma subunit